MSGEHPAAVSIQQQVKAVKAQARRDPANSYKAVLQDLNARHVDMTGNVLDITSGTEPERRSIWADDLDRAERQAEADRARQERQAHEPEQDRSRGRER